ncbi:MAG: molecular chaperone DnaJ [Candidatus Diapherotrites archaeon]|nr:molecular chaperone DnaJ [Candidatus Diapherotrites archaeon]
MGDLFGFGGAFGGRQQRKSAPRRGSDLRFDLNIPFEEAAFGTERTIEVERLEQCGECKGAGGSGEETCYQCKGSGVTGKTQRTPFGIFSTQTTCGKCGGSGRAIRNPCKKCGGLGIVRARKKIKVKIPAGIDNGNHLRLGGEGNSGAKGGPAGDLFVVVFVEPHKLFKRDGVDIFTEMPISFSEAALGTKLDVPTLDGAATVKIPPGTQSGTIFRLKGKGIRQLRGNGYGDLYAKVIVETPRGMSRKQRELFEEIKKEENMREERKRFF